MRAGRVVAIAGVVAGLVGLVAITTAQAQSGSSGRPGTDGGSQPNLPQVPLASAAGGSVASLVYPSVVAVHLDRSRAAIAGAEAAFDDPRNMVRAANQMGNARVQMVAAWQATKYVIRTTPPPPPPAGRAGSSGGAPAGPSFAAPPDTSFAVFSLQHDLVTHAAGLLGKDAALNGRLTAVMQKTATRRDAAVAYIHQVAPPAPPGDGRAGASGGAVTSGFDTTMPSVLPLLDDEMQALKGTLALNPTLPAGVRTALQALVATDTQTEATINTFWPPIVGDN